MMTTPHAERNEPVDELTADELDLVAGGWFAGWGTSSGSGSATTGGSGGQISIAFAKVAFEY
jgi:pectate lyase